MSYQDDMRIDENALDLEFLEQPELMVKYSSLLATAKMERDLMKEELDLEKAELDLDIREDPSKYSLGKVTEAALTNVIIQEKDYQEIQSRLHKANFEVNVLQGVVNAIDARKSSLENLVKLHGQEYFAGPSVPHDLSALRQEKSDEIQHKIGKTFRRTKPLKK